MSDTSDTSETKTTIEEKADAKKPIGPRIAAQAARELGSIARVFGLRGLEKSLVDFGASIDHGAEVGEKVGRVAEQAAAAYEKSAMKVLFDAAKDRKSPLSGVRKKAAPKVETSPKGR